LVLLVDDDEDWRALIAEVLVGEGFAVSTASDGRAALASLQQMRPQVVVTDVEMPLMDGCEVLARVRALDRALPVIVLTAADPSDGRLILPGAFRVIRKPTTTDAVVCAVREALAGQRLPRLRRMASAARTVASVTLNRGSGVLTFTTSLFRRATIAERLPGAGRLRRRPGRLAVVAGFGAVAAAAVVIAAIRGLAA
jgi:CheY-like chemotaxis protein